MNTELPLKLNSYPVINHHVHKNCVTVLIEKPNEYVVATWWPELKTTWMWGHYFPHSKGTEQDAFNRAHKDFSETAKRNANR